MNGVTNSLKFANDTNMSRCVESKEHKLQIDFTNLVVICKMSNVMLPW